MCRCRQRRNISGCLGNRQYNRLKVKILWMNPPEMGDFVFQREAGSVRCMEIAFPLKRKIVTIGKKHKIFPGYSGQEERKI